MTTTINGIQYEALKMTPREQLHLMRRLSPLVGALKGGLFALLDKSRPQGEVLAELAASIGPLTETLAMLPDATVDHVMDSCLAHVRRLDTDDKWHPIYVNSMPMYQDIDAVIELQLVSEVVTVNLSGFFALLSGGGASSLSAPAAQ